MPQVKLITTSELWFEVEKSDIVQAYNSVSHIDNDRISGAYLDKDPIAVALRSIGKYRAVFVGWLTISAYKGPICHEYQILNAKEVTTALRAFDNNKEIEPFTVKLFLERETRREPPIQTKKKTPRERLVLSTKGELIP